MLSVVVPVYNEADVIEKNVDRLRKHLKGRSEIVLGENGSKDGSAEICDRLAGEYKDVRTIHTKKGLGRALKALIEKAEGEKVVYMPADLAVDVKFIDQAERLLDEVDIVVGSKRMEGAVDDRVYARRFASFIFNSLVNLFLNLGLKDSQCTKGFRKSKVEGLLNKTSDRGFFFEVELLYYAKKKGLRMEEVPVVVRDKGRSSVRIVRDSLKLLKKLLGFSVSK